MQSVLVAWASSAIILVLGAAFAGRRSGKGVLGLLIDDRGRFSLTHFQVVLWTIVIFSLIAGIFFARLASDRRTALEFTIPNEVLLLTGISIGSASISTAIKAGKDARNAHIRRVGADEAPRFAQVYLQEEGSASTAPSVDVTKFQNYWLTVILVIAYVATAIGVINSAKTIADVSIPILDGTFVTLLGISHAGYLAAKIPDKAA